MGDPSPLLSSRVDSVESNTLSFDDLIDRVGGLSRAQLVQAVILSVTRAFAAQQAFISVFTDEQPNWHCTRDGDIMCSSATNPCELPQPSWAWDWPVHASVVSEWALICAGPFMEALPASSFYMGSLAGMILLSSLADTTLGRKNMLLLSCLLMSSTGALTVFAPNVWAYSFLRLLSGFGRATIGASVLVLSTETVGSRWRGQVGNLGFFFYTIGFLSLPAIAYWLGKGSSWRILYLWTSIPALCYCVLIYFFVHESPRWLSLQARKDEAIQTLRTTASMPGDNEAQNIDVYSSLKMLWASKWAFRRESILMVVGLGIGLVYFGLPLGTGNLSFNIYLSVVFNALAELPATLITLLLIQRLKRRNSIIAFSIVSGICSGLCVVLGGGDGGSGRSWLEVGVEVVSFFSACTACNVLMIYTLELFPTCVRTSAVCMLNQAITIGGVISPMLVAAGRRDGFISYGVFGLGIGCCGLFVTLLPETQGKFFCDTMEEQENEELLQ